MNLTSELLPPLRHVWRQGVAVGRAYELLLADVQDHLRQVQKAMGYRYCRFHGLFHDEMGIVVRDPEGRLHMQWRHFDAVVDFLLSIGLRPFLELNPMPAALAGGDQTFFHWRMNVTPPRDYGEWEALVEATVRHAVDRYGLEEVRRWYFEVWNEPNLDAFWTGGQEAYWKLYAASARAVKRVDGALRIGGPAGAEAGWVRELLDFCARDAVPVDFVSAHLYPQNEFARFRHGESVHAPGDYFESTLRDVKRSVEESAFPGVEIHWTEWNSLSADSPETIDWLQNPSIDRVYAAACALDVVVSCDDAADSLFWWVASDVFAEAGVPTSPFSGTYGLVTVHGIPKASFHAFRLLNRMRGPRRRIDKEGGGPHSGALATEDGELIHLLLWRHVPPGVSGTAWSGEIRGEGLVTGRMVTEVQVKPCAGSPAEAWEAMGRPQNLTPAQQEALEAAAVPATRSYPLSGSGIPFHLAPGEVLYLEIAPPATPATPKATMLEEAQAWNVGMGANS